MILTRLEIFKSGKKNNTLSLVADIRFGSGPAQINRYDRARQENGRSELSKGIALEMLSLQ